MGGRNTTLCLPGTRHRLCSCCHWSLVSHNTNIPTLLFSAGQPPLGTCCTHTHRNTGTCLTFLVSSCFLAGNPRQHTQTDPRKLRQPLMHLSLVSHHTATQQHPAQHTPHSHLHQTLLQSPPVTHTTTKVTHLPTQYCPAQCHVGADGLWVRKRKRREKAGDEKRSKAMAAERKAVS